MSMLYRKKLGKNIKYYRKLQDLSQEKLAELVSKSRNDIGMIERGEINTPVDTIFKISKVLKIEPKQLFDFL